MSAEVFERSFEDAIECGLLQHGPDACVGDTKAVHETPAPYGTTLPGGYRKRAPGDYDRALCFLPRDVVDFVLATQPKEWQRHPDRLPRRSGTVRCRAERGWLRPRRRSSAPGSRAS